MNLNDLFNEEKVRLDPHCWDNKKIGNPKTKVKGGVRVNNCVPKESVEEAKPPGARQDPVWDLTPLEGPGHGGGHQIPTFTVPIIPNNVPGGANMPMAGRGNMSRDMATGRNVGGKEIPSLGQASKVVTSPAADRALTTLGGKNVSTTSGPSVTVQKRGSEYEPLAADVPAYVRKGLPDPVTTPANKLKIKVKPGETMDQAVQRTKAEQEFNKFLQGQGGQSFGTAGGGRGGQGGPTAAQATSGAGQVPTIKLPNGQTIPDPARLSPSGNYNTPSDSKMDKIMKKWDQENSPAKSKGQRPWGSNVDDQPGSVKSSNPKSKNTSSKWLQSLGGGADKKTVDEEQSRKKRKEPEVNYDAIDHDKSVARLRHLAGIGPMKTVWDPARRVYKNVPTADQPKR